MLEKGIAILRFEYHGLKFKSGHFAAIEASLLFFIFIILVAYSELECSPVWCFSWLSFLLLSLSSTIPDPEGLTSFLADT
jgi:hypothetical protein